MLLTSIVAWTSFPVFVQSHQNLRIRAHYPASGKSTKSNTQCRRYKSRCFFRGHRQRERPCVVVVAAAGCALREFNMRCDRPGVNSEPGGHSHKKYLVFRSLSVSPPLNQSRAVWPPHANLLPYDVASRSDMLAESVRLQNLRSRSCAFAPRCGADRVRRIQADRSVHR